MKLYKLNILITLILITGCMTGCEQEVAMTGLTINKTELTIGYGKKAILTAGSEPVDGTGAKYTWASNNPNVATVEPYGEGWMAWVTGTGIGTTSITLTSGGFTKTVNVEVTVTSVTITNPEDATQGSYDVGDEVQLTATIAPDQGLTPIWESSDTEVATVTQTGLVNVVGSGTAVISAAVGPVRTEFSLFAISLLDLAVGHWQFDDPGNLLKATIGAPLEIGYLRSGTVTQANGPTATNKAAFVTKDAWFKCLHGIAANGGTKIVNGAEAPCERVNEYTVMFDIMVPNAAVYHAVIQCHSDNVGEASQYLKSRGRVGVGDFGEAPEGTIKDGVWYRMIFSVKLGTYYHFYMNGAYYPNWEFGTYGSLDHGRHSLTPNDFVVFFGDGDPNDAGGSDSGHDDNDLYIAEIAVWDYPLTTEEVATLGMFEVDE
jgi:hypothetical protein